MNPYDKFRQAEHIQRQAVSRFGQMTPQAARMKAVVDYWFGQWVDDRCSVIAPPADILEARIKDEEKIIDRRGR